MKYKGGEEEMEKREIVRVILVDKCNLCGKEITGSTEEQINYNMRIHKDAKHQEETIKFSIKKKNENVIDEE